MVPAFNSSNMLRCADHLLITIFFSLSIIEMEVSRDAIHARTHANTHAHTQT